jgi:predicted O-methyltransferase YrrM
MFKKIQQAAIFNTLRILKQVNPGDAYYEAYLGHLQTSGPELYDLYMLLWEIAVDRKPRRILEIGTRTGLSLCQLMSAYIDPNIIQKIVCIDPFEDMFISKHLVLKNLRYLNLPTDKIEFLEGFSQDFLPKMNYVDKERFDYILVDGDHEKKAARNDLELALGLLAHGGVIVFDDISDAPGECALIDVWMDFKTCHANEFEYVQENMSGKGVAWAIRKASTP